MTTQKPAVEHPGAQVESTVLDAKSVLSASIKTEKERKGTDLELLHLLESTILRVDAPGDAWEQAAAAIKKLTLSRAESRMATP
jgi:hypothetical protein